MRPHARRTPNLIKAGLASVLIVTVVATAAAQDQSLPSAEFILDKHVEATGGSQAWSQLKNYVYEGLYGRPGSDRQYKMIHYANSEGRHLEITSQDGKVVLERGLNGAVAWGRYAGRPAERITGDMEDRLRYEWTFAPDANWRQVFGYVKTKGIVTVEGKECYEVTRRPNAGTPTETAYYDASTYRLLRVDRPRNAGDEESTLETIYTDYRDVGGLMIPHTITRRLGQSGRLYTIETARHNVDLPDDQFAIPTELQPEVEDKPAATNGAPAQTERDGAARKENAESDGGTD